MKIFPAIDIKDGKVVRLFQGDYDKVTIYNDDPRSVALQFKSAGAENLHIVDLDGARDGILANYETIKSIAEDAKMFVQVGGGIRDEQRIKQYLEAGVSRVILGTVAVTDFDFLCRMTDKYGERIAVGVDAKDGFVAINGWKDVTEVKSFDFCRKLSGAGVKTIIYTDISMDGGLAGTNLAAYERLREIKGLDIIASGGITFKEEITALAKAGTYGAILGKALYSGRLELAQALVLAKGSSAAPLRPTTEIDAVQC